MSWVEQTPAPAVTVAPPAALAEIVALYRQDRTAVDARHPAVADAMMCRYCGRERRMWKNARFEGHVGCVVSPLFMHRLTKFFEQSRLGYADVALALEVTPAIVRAWWNIAKGNPR